MLQPQEGPPVVKLQALRGFMLETLLTAAICIYRGPVWFGVCLLMSQKPPLFTLAFYFVVDRKWGAR